MKLVFATLVLLLYSGLLVAQNIAGINNEYRPVEAGKTGNLDLQFQSLSFFLNNEYKGNMVDGYTWTGAWLQPKLRYTFSEKLSASVGGHFLRYHGREDFTITRPWFSVQYRVTDKLTAVFGNLNQNNNHGLLKQLWDPERSMTDAPEEGIQFLYNSKAVDFQLWVDWRQLILKNDPWQEHFTFGWTGDARIYSGKNTQWSVPLHILAYHQGGEIDSSPLGVVTHYNVTTGLKMSHQSQGSFFNQINVGAYWLGYKCPDGPEPLKYTSGNGWTLMAEMESRWGTFSLDYWSASKFTAPFGKKLYQSLSDIDWWLSQDKRSLASFNYMLKKEIVTDLHFALQTEAVFDLKTSDLSLGLGFYLLINHDFLLKKFN